jgi:hypothetical protein
LISWVLAIDRAPRFLLLHVGRKTAALEDESGDDAVEDRVVEETVVHILKKILDGDGRIGIEKLDRDVPQAGR